LVVNCLFAERVESDDGSIQYVAFQCDLQFLFREFMKSHSRTKVSYLLLLRTSNHFERFSADFLCIGWIDPLSMRQNF
jgi:hypothetical protein